MRTHRLGPDILWITIALLAYVLIHFLLTVSALKFGWSADGVLRNARFFRRIAAHLLETGQAGTGVLTLLIAGPFIGIATAFARSRDKNQAEKTVPFVYIVQFMIFFILLVGYLLFDCPVGRGIFGFKDQYSTLPLLVHNLFLTVISYASARLAMNATSAAK